MDRFVIDSYGPDDDALRDAIVWLVEQAQQRGTEAAIVVPAVRSIESLGRVLGSQVAAFAEKHRHIRLGGVTVHVFSPKTQPYSFEGPVLVPWANSKMVEAAERLSPPAICATGWSEGGLDDWKRTWAPLDPRGGQTEMSADEPPPAVRGAVKSLSGPLGNDVVHPMDKRRAVDAFKALQMTGHRVDPVLVRALAVRHGWEPDAADRLREIAAKMAEGRTVQGGSHLNATRAKELVAYFESDPD